MDPTCPDCRGTGFRLETREGGVTVAAACGCDVRDRGQRLLRSARIPRRYDHCTFEQFECHGASQGVHASNKAAAQDWVERWPMVDRGLLFIGRPGSGKTRVLVHRIAYLVRAMRENPRGIIALAYNRHAAVEIRRRLAALIGEDAKGVTVLTCHALAMRLAGLSFARRAGVVDDEVLKTVIPRAVALLKGEGLAVEEADEQRELAAFALGGWISVVQRGRNG